MGKLQEELVDLRKERDEAYYAYRLEYARLALIKNEKDGPFKEPTLKRIMLREEVDNPALKALRDDYIAKKIKVQRKRVDVRCAEGKFWL